MGGLIGALVVLVVVVLGFVLLRDVTRTQPQSPVRAVDYQQTLGYARQHADFPLLAPPRLPHGWRATSVTFIEQGSQRWHLGVLTDKNKYVGLEQADTPVREMVTTYVDPSPSRGAPVTIDGKTWTSWSDAGGDHALARRQAHVTTLVVGTVSRAVLRDYVRSLR